MLVPISKLHRPPDLKRLEIVDMKRGIPESRTAACPKMNSTLSLGIIRAKDPLIEPRCGENR